MTPAAPGRENEIAVLRADIDSLDVELLTLIKTGKMAVLPILLYGREFWDRVINFDALVEEGVVAPQDLDLFHFCDTAEEGWAFVQDYYERFTERQFRKGRGDKK